MKWLLASTESFQRGDIPDTVKSFIKANPHPFIILDESSKIKTNSACKEEKKSKRTQAIKKLNETGERCILTGTFMSVSPVNAYDQMEFLCKNFWGENMYSFENTYCIMIHLKIGRGIRTLITEDIWKVMHKRLAKAAAKSQKDLETTMQMYTNMYSISESRQKHILENEEYSPFINLDDLYKRIERCTMVVKKEDALDLPEKLNVEVRVEMPDSMKKLYKEILSSGTLGECAVPDGIAMYHRLQDVCNGYTPYQDGTTLDQKTGKEKPVIKLNRAAENPKLDTLVDYLDGIDVKRHKAIVWSNRKLLLHDAYDRLMAEGYRCCLYDGDTSDAEKEEIEDDFTKGKIDVFIGNQKSGGFGLDWLKAANYMIFVSNDRSPETRKQAEERFHRGNCGTEKKTVVDIVAEGSVDQRVASGLRRGLQLINSGSTDREVFDLEEEEEEVVF